MIAAVRRKRVAILIIVAIPITVIAYSLLMTAIGHPMTISTDKMAYRHGETITFTVRNNGLASIEFGDPGLGFGITNLDTGKPVSLGRLYPQVIHQIPPFGWETTSWDQTQFIRGETQPFVKQQVAPGNYAASVSGGIGSESIQAEVRFRITE